MELAQREIIEFQHPRGATKNILGRSFSGDACYLSILSLELFEMQKQEASHDVRGTSRSVTIDLHDSWSQGQKQDALVLESRVVHHGSGFGGRWSKLSLQTILISLYKTMEEWRLTATPAHFLAHPVTISHGKLTISSARSFPKRSTVRSS